MPSLLVIEHPCMLQSSVRQELGVKSLTLLSSGSYFDIKTTQAPQPPATNHGKAGSSKLGKKLRLYYQFNNNVLTLESVFFFHIHRIIFHHAFFLIISAQIFTWYDMNMIEFMCKTFYNINT